MNKVPDVIVSVIIPNYNRTTALSKAINSVVEQSIKDIEVLIIDDYSEKIQEITEIVNSFNDGRLKLITNNHKVGGAKARNIGIIKAKGYYIAFLDSDDTWREDKLEKQLDLIRKHPNSLVYCQSKVFNKANTLILPVREIQVGENLSEYLFLRSGLIQTSSILIEKDVALKSLFNETYQRHQDYDFLFQLEGKIQNFKMVKEPLVNIFWNSGVGLRKKGWSPQVSIKLLKEYELNFTEESWCVFYFQNVIILSATYGLKLFSLKQIINNKKVLFHIPRVLIFEYVVKLFFDWRWYYNPKIK